MTDLQRFKEFFKEMGVSFWAPTHTDSHRHGEEPQQSIYNLSVSQAIFCFDKDENYIGVVSDEMGVFDRRADGCMMIDDELEEHEE